MKQPLVCSSVRSEGFSIMVVATSQGSPSIPVKRFVGPDEPTLLLMAGRPGVGKSWLANILEKELGWKVIDKDRHIMEQEEKGLGNYQAGWEAYEQSFKVARSELLKHCSVILDSAALHEFILDRAIEIVSEIQNGQLKVIHCVANRALREENLRKRSDPHPRSSTALPPDEDEVQLFNHLPPEPLRLTLDMSQPYEEILSKSKEYLLSCVVAK